MPAKKKRSSEAAVRAIRRRARGSGSARPVTRRCGSCTPRGKKSEFLELAIGHRKQLDLLEHDVGGRE
jgi:hypothetical protein